MPMEPFNRTSGKTTSDLGPVHIACARNSGRCGHRSGSATCVPSGGSPHGTNHHRGPGRRVDSDCRGEATSLRCGWALRTWFSSQSISPVKLLRAICTYLDEGTFHAFAALLRMPAVSAMLRRLHRLPIDYLQQVDRYYEATLLRSVNVAKWPESPYLECVSQVVSGIDEWLQPLRSPKQRLCDWSKPLLSVMQTCYGATTVDLDQSVDACLWDACSQVTDGIARLADIPDSVQIEIALTEAVAWVQRFLDKARVPPPQDPSAVELLGWLELALDDAEVLILSGFMMEPSPSRSMRIRFYPMSFDVNWV